MVKAQWIGGPADGGWAAVDPTRPVVVALRQPPSFKPTDEGEAITIKTVSIYATRLPSGDWRLVWPKDAWG